MGAERHLAAPEPSTVRDGDFMLEIKRKRTLRLKAEATVSIPYTAKTLTPCNAAEAAWVQVNGSTIR